MTSIPIGKLRGWQEPRVHLTFMSWAKYVLDIQHGDPDEKTPGLKREPPASTNFKWSICLDVLNNDPLGSVPKWRIIQNRILCEKFISYSIRNKNFTATYVFDEDRSNIPISPFTNGAIFISYYNFAEKYLSHWMFFPEKHQLAFRLYEFYLLRLMCWIKFLSIQTIEN